MDELGPSKQNIPKISTTTPIWKYLAIVLFIILPLVGFYLGMLYPQTSSLPSSTVESNTKIPLPTPTESLFSDKPARGFTMTIEEMILDEATDPSIVTIERGEYEIPIEGSSTTKKVAGNKFILTGENFENPKVKNASEYLRSLGFNPEQPIKIVESPGYVIYGFMLSYGKLNRIYITEGSFTQMTDFLSDPFTLEE